MSKKKIVSMIVSLLIVGLVLVTGGVLFTLDYFYSKMEITDHLIYDEVGIRGRLLEKERGGHVINIAVLGIDGEDNHSNRRSEMVKVISLDMRNQTVKLISIQSDMLVYTPDVGQDFERLGHVYGYGKAPLTLKVLNETFDLDITRYVALKLEGMEQMIEMINGIELDVHKDEVKMINEQIKQLNRMADTDMETSSLVTDGIQTLSGQQAMAYMRNGDESDGVARIQRQQKVIDAVIDKVMNQSYMTLLRVLSACLPYVETNLTQNELIKFGLKALTFDLEKMEEMDVPASDYKHDLASYKGDRSFYIVDCYQNLVHDVHEFIYNESYYQSSIPMVDIWLRLEEESEWVATSGKGYFFRSSGNDSTENYDEGVE